MFIDSNLVAELLDDFLKLHDPANLFSRQASVLALLDRGLGEGVEADPRRLLHVRFRRHGKARVQLAALVNIDGELGPRLDLANHLLDGDLGKLDSDRTKVDS